MKYSQELKGQMVKKLLMPGGPSGLALSRETGIPQSTLAGWVKKYKEGGTVGQNNTPKRSQDWSAEEVLEVLKEASSLKGEEFGAYLRSKGLHSHQLDEWRQDFVESFSQKRGRGRPKLNPEVTALRQENKELSKELRRKDRALAEATARVVLLKKAEILFGKVPEDEE